MSGYSMDYEELETALAGAALACGAAEAHGLLCGLLSGGSGTEEAHLMELVEYLRVVVTLLVDELLLAQAEEKRGVKS